MGNSASTGDVILDIGRKVGSVALAVSYFTPAAIVTIPATAVVGTVGLTTEIVGRAIDNETTREVGGFFRGLAFDAAIDGVSGGAIEGVKLSKGAAEVIKVGCETFSKVSDEVDKINGEYIPTPDPQTTLLFAKNIKNIF